jgi:glycosyltransferase involved in cell wall biosynthesis
MKLLLIANTDWFLFNYRLAQARYMRAQGYTVGLVSPPGPFVERLRAEGFGWTSWPVARQGLLPWQEAGAILRLVSIFKKEKPDLVHAFTLKAALYSGLAALRMPRVHLAAGITGRGYLFLSNVLRARLARPVAVTLMRLAFRTPRCACLFENDLDRADFIARGITTPSQSHLIPGAGADTARFTPAPEPPGPPVILFAGRLLWEKGLAELVEAARLLRARGLSFRLALAGATDPGNPGSLTEADLHAWESAGEVEWWGFQPNMEETFRRVHIVTLPTFYGEGVPTVLMEAAAAGLPLVATDHPGCAAVVRSGENGLLVAPRDPAALADALERLVQDAPLRTRMGAAGRKLAVEAFSHEKINRETLKVYFNFGIRDGLQPETGNHHD